MRGASSLPLARPMPLPKCTARRIALTETGYYDSLEGTGARGVR